MKRPVRIRTSLSTAGAAGAAAALGLALAVSGCGAGSAGGQASDGGDSSNSDSSDNTAADTGQEEFRVLAASSLTTVFDDLADTFEAEHAEVEVVADYGSSTDLAAQAAQGAPGDVLATADETSMAVARDAGVVAGPSQVFATNALVIVVPPDNPADVETLADLADADWVRCADDVPCGRVAQAVLRADDVTAAPVSLEDDARATLDKVRSGEAEAGLVYASDAISAGTDVTTIEIPGAEQQRTTYVVSSLTQSGDADLAADWAALLVSDEGRSALEDAGFTLP